MVACSRSTLATWAPGDVRLGVPGNQHAGGAEGGLDCVHIDH
jgi:hypothetical protein